VKRESRKFQSSKLTRYLVPVILALLLLGLLAILVALGLALAGIFPQM
jgi:hypothetical protein